MLEKTLDLLDASWRMDWEASVDWWARMAVVWLCLWALS